MAIVIAEFCQNHNGDIEIMKRMIHAAAEAGAHYAKIQSIFVEDLTSRPEFEQETFNDSGDMITFKRPYKAEYERLKSLELDYEVHRLFISECEKAGIQSLTTVFSRKRVRDLIGLGFQAVKVASYDCGSLPLINDISDKFSHLFISTGASFENEIKETASVLRNREFYFLHCVTVYPTPLTELNLNKMAYLKQFTPLVGFSDHSLVERDGIKASIAALAMGASVIERHFTVLDRDKTKDGPVSIDKEQLKELCACAKMEKAELMSKAIAIPEFQSITEAPLKLDLSEQELLNRRYYRGRFASNIDGRFVYNWEELYDSTR